MAKPFIDITVRACDKDTDAKSLIDLQNIDIPDTRAGREALRKQLEAAFSSYVGMLIKGEAFDITFERKEH